MKKLFLISLILLPTIKADHNDLFAVKKCETSAVCPTGQTCIKGLCSTKVTTGTYAWHK